ncbi:MAG: sulfurtransferase TusA family protein [Actinobacteria bacterium]|nr:sulfurtransferase TusA family protein [Actinomycetota bacterium]MDA2985318.1 sulfurtransferase TusA family protein [Actinomycetota bacterium]
MGKVIRVDALGTLCPIPIIELSKTMRRFVDEQEFRLESDDVATWSDLKAWARLTKNQVKQIDTNTFEITRGLSDSEAKKAES